MKITNKKGSILVITAGFALIFTMLGLGSIQLSGLQNEAAEKRRASGEAIWLADAGVERAKIKSHTFVQAPIALGNGIYDFTANLCNTTGGQVPACICLGTPQNPTYCTHRWAVDSKGVVNNQGAIGDQKRSILAVLGDFKVSNAITAEGPFNYDCNPDGSAQIQGTCEQNVQDLTLFNEFRLTYTNDYNGNISIINKDGTALTFNNYTDSNYDTNTNNYAGLTIITSTGNQSIFANKINTNGSNTAANPGFLIIDCQSADPCYKSTSNVPFYGIVWVIGNVNMQGTPALTGSLFVENGTVSGNMNGNNTVKYDESIINMTLENIGAGSLKIPTVISWKEK